VNNLWSNPLFREIAAVAVAKNAVIVSGLNRDKQDYLKISAGVAALDLRDGKVLWRHDLPATPTAWGLAVTGDGSRLVVTLMDGRVLAFAR
jgi:hypothetical protein